MRREIEGEKKLKDKMINGKGKKLIDFVGEQE